ncbi:FAD/FMN-containing dehydrogenase [Geosmithia morbida]|uniref:FAD/FMN-containing dehydrogenase n=1 Tax=Geosmithia morbida TaxID=1094350 RepID=A0A9P4YWL3_9HYPO|nr:FAD/FMN-containing dehydrogenase [Geosmithia morbida]KAF4123099.1 FAD/FMN-containing dehydrogenase [Geosmithia morbida]
MHSLMNRLPTLSLLLGVVLADTCSLVADLTSVQVSLPLTLSYTVEQNEYWSESCTLLTPSCIIFPRSAQEVAAVVDILRDQDEQFAVKSGGHNPNLYWSSVSGGPVISTAELDEVTLDPETGVLRVGPGNRLQDVATALDGTGWTFVGGRIGNTGVGGLMLGGGLSYLSAQHGWAASSVLEYEVVLADGSVVTASASSHPDLYVALKGGGNNFGVVTAYTVQAYRQGSVYGGNLVFQHTDATAARLLQAVRDFTEYNDDDRAAVIVTAERAALNAVDTWILFVFYDGADPPADLFANFTDAGPFLNTLRVRSYASMINLSNWVVVQASTVDISTETIPIPSHDDGPDFLGDIHSFWRSTTSSVMSVPGIVASIAYQPFPKRIAAAARDTGRPDLIDADPDADKLILEINYSFLPGPFDYMADVTEATYTGIRDRAVAAQEQGILPDDVYLPVFMNYAFFRQDYWDRLKPESRALAQTVAENYDPDGLFRDRTGGWKP